MGKTKDIVSSYEVAKTYPINPVTKKTTTIAGRLPKTPFVDH